jgi:hypothetical protein
MFLEKYYLRDLPLLNDESIIDDPFRILQFKKEISNIGKKILVIY